MYNTYYICNRGIAQDCDHRPSKVKSDCDDFDPSDFRSIQSGDVVFLSSYQLKHFLQFFSKDPKPIVLVTGASDCSAPQELCERQNIPLPELLNEPWLKHWFAQNCDIEHAKVTPIPIGIDYHTLASWLYYWGHFRTPPYKQEKTLRHLAESSPPWRDRRPQIYCNFQFKIRERHNFDRSACEAALKQLSCCYWQPRRMRRENTWKTQRSFQFVASPLGVGIDCHRTWEALVLGCVPIIRRSTITPMFEGLPALWVDDYSEITEEVLNRFEYRMERPEKLTLQYWVDLIHDECVR